MRCKNRYFAKQKKFALKKKHLNITAAFFFHADNIFQDLDDGEIRKNILTLKFITLTCFLRTDRQTRRLFTFKNRPTDS